MKSSRTAALLTGATLMFTATLGLAAGGGGAMPSAPSGGNSDVLKDPVVQARYAYDAGVKLIEKADALDAEAGAAPADKQAKLEAKAQKIYGSAIDKFSEAVGHQGTFFQAWNYIGYAQRHLGNYDQSLAAYDRALSINPMYHEAIEYRGHAYLGLNRLDEAKDAYMTLFRDARALSDKLLKAMQGWVDAHRKDAGNVDAATIDGFAQWVTERSAVAQQTASLAVDSGTASSWR
jgi:tetratricopeptide (TPR) repeat protein